MSKASKHDPSLREFCKKGLVFVPVAFGIYIPKFKARAQFAVSDIGRSNPTVAAPGCAFSDNFSRADAATLGAGWTKATGFFDLGITSNQCVAKTAGSHNVDFFTNCGEITADHWAQFTLTSSNIGEFFGLTLRGKASTGTYYTFYGQGGTSGASLYQWITSAAPTQLDAGNWFSNPVNGDVFYFQIAGTVLTLKQNGSTVKTFTTDGAIDGAIVGDKFAGIDLFGTGTSVDDFSCGAL